MVLRQVITSGLGIGLVVVASFVGPVVHGQDGQGTDQAWDPAQNMDEHRKQKRAQYLQSIQKEHREFEPVRAELERIANGKGSKQDVKHIVSYIKEVPQRDISTSAKNQLMVGLPSVLYLFLDTIQPAYVCLDKTGERFAFHQMLPIYKYKHEKRMKGPLVLNVDFIKSISDKRLTNYWVEYFVHHLTKATENFYSNGTGRSSAPLDFSGLLALSMFPQTPKLKRFLLNYAFEQRGHVWWARTHGIPTRRTGLPKRHFKRVQGIDQKFVMTAPLAWYYQRIICGTPLQKEFDKKLRKRNLLQEIKKKVKKYRD